MTAFLVFYIAFSPAFWFLLGWWTRGQVGEEA